MKKIDVFIRHNKTYFSIILFLFSLTLFLLLTMRVDSDYFWHIKAGEYMFKNGILKKDIFSWFVNGKYWMSHEWLFEIIIYGFKVLFGKFHMLIYGGICLFSLLLIIFLANKNKCLENIPFTLFWFCLSLILVVFVQARPHLISFCLVGLAVWFLYDLYLNENSKKIYLLPIISIIWANVHGGSSNLSYLFCFVFLLFGLFSFNFSKIVANRINRKQIVKYLIIMFLCMIGVCINIHGFKMFTYPYLNMLDSVMINNISEWQSTSLNNPQHYMYFVLIIIIVFIMLFSKKKILFIDFVLFGISLFLGLKSIRFWGYTYIIMSFVIFRYVNKKSVDIGTNLCIVIFSSIIILFSIFNINFNNLTNHVLDSDLIILLKKESPDRLYNMYDYGGELIYNDCFVFIDGRADLYSKYNYKDYLDISLLHNDYIKLINKYDFDYFLVNSTYPINTYLTYNNDYLKIYSRDGIILYKKKSN